MSSLPGQDPPSNSTGFGDRLRDIIEKGIVPKTDRYAFAWVLRFEKQYLDQMKDLLNVLQPSYWAMEDSSQNIQLIIIHTSPIKESSLVGFPLTAESLYANEYKKSYPKRFATWKTPVDRPILPKNIDSIVRQSMEENLKNGKWTMHDLMSLDAKAVSSNRSRLSLIPKEVHQRRGLTFFWLYGHPGTGKTLYWQTFADFHGFRAISKAYESSKYLPFSGYEEVLALEHMPIDISSRRDSMGVEELLKFVEEGVFYLKDKHSKELARNQVVFIVSWCSPSEIKFHKNKEKNAQLMAEVLRRIHFVGSFKKNCLPVFQKGSAALRGEKKPKYEPILPASWLKETGMKGFDHLINGNVVRWEDVDKEQGDKKIIQ